jgi:cobalamin synthase
MSPIPPNPDRAVTDLMDELYAQSMRPHRRIVRWCRRWLACALVVAFGLPVLVWRAMRGLVAYPCFAAWVVGAILRRRLLGRDE